MAVDDFSIALMALIGIRFLASTVFLDMLFRQKKNRHLVLTFAWFIYFIGPLWALIKYNQSGITDTPLFAFTAALATLLLIGSVFLTFRAINNCIFADRHLSRFYHIGVRGFDFSGSEHNICDFFPVDISTDYPWRGAF